MPEQKPSFMQELELDLKERMVGVPEDKQAELIRFTREKVLQSYRNGQASSKRPERRYRRAAAN